MISASNPGNNNKLFGGEHPFKGTTSYSYNALGRKVSKELTPGHGNRVMISGYYNGRGTKVLAEYEDNVWNMNQYRNDSNNGNIQGGQRNYLNEYYYARGLVAFNNMKNPNQWNIRPDVNFYHKDAHGSITAITGRNGNVVERYSYGAYGNPYQGRFLYMQKDNPYGFTGQRYEAELRLYSFAYRTYNPVNMRWLTPDPARDGMNWYQYVSGDPVNLWDPLGLCYEGRKGPVGPGNVAITKEARTLGFVVRHPITAYNIGQVESGSTNISTNAVRFSTRNKTK